MLNDNRTMDNQVEPTTRPRRKAKKVPLSRYEEVLNLVRNTLHIDEREALDRAGYSPGVHNHWRKEERVPLVAVNALLGLLVGLEIAKQDDGRAPLMLTIEQVVELANSSKSTNLKAALYREAARRLEGK